MFDLGRLVRANIQALKPYSSARDEFKGTQGVFLDANENPFGTLNRYPDPYQNTLKQKLSKIKDIDKDHIFLGNGSDEIIDLIYRIFCNPGKDKALTFTPTFGMYQVAADINNVELINLPLTHDFEINIKTLKPCLHDNALKLIFICSPNNPTGNIFKKEHIKFILDNFKGIVIIDEAYIDFSNSKSWNQKLENHPNLIVLQTFSKAWALASARIGIAYANKDIIQLLNKVKLPYNISELNQKAVIKALDNQSLFESNLNTILLEKRRLIEKLNEFKIIKKIFPSDANFLLVEFEDANKTYQDLVNHKIITRNRHNLVKNCIRITVGTPEENQKLLRSLKNIES